MKADAVETAKLYRVIETRSQEAGVTLTDEQESELSSEIDQLIENLGGEEAYQSYLEQLCISEEGFLRLNRVYFLNQGLLEKMTGDGELDDLDDFLEEQGTYAAKHILISTRRLGEDGYTRTLPRRKKPRRSRRPRISGKNSPRRGTPKRNLTS